MDLLLQFCKLSCFLTWCKSVIQTKQACPIIHSRTGVRVYPWEMRSLSSPFLDRIWIPDPTLQAGIWTEGLLGKRWSMAMSSPPAHIHTQVPGHFASLAWQFRFLSSRTKWVFIPVSAEISENSWKSLSSPKLILWWISNLLGKQLLNSMLSDLITKHSYFKPGKYKN